MTRAHTGAKRGKEKEKYMWIQVMHFVTNELDRSDRQEIHFFLKEKLEIRLGNLCKSHFLFCFSPQMGFQSETKSQ